MAILRNFGAKWYAQCLCADRQLRHWYLVDILSNSMFHMINIYIYIYIFIYVSERPDQHFLDLTNV